MKKIFMLFMLLCEPAHAATMCVPDLSTCDSCVAIGTDENMWIADCCGVRVSGYVLPLWVAGWGEDICSNVSVTIGEEFHNVGDFMLHACVMVSPIIPKYAYVIYSPDWEYYSGLENCATLFKPKCAFSECYETVCAGWGAAAI